MNYYDNGLQLLIMKSNYGRYCVLSILNLLLFSNCNAGATEAQADKTYVTKAKPVDVFSKPLTCGKE